MRISMFSLGVAVAVAMFALVSAPRATLAQPSNDNFPGQVVTAFPFDSDIDTTGATLEPGEPSNPNEGNSAWFTYTETSPAAIDATTVGGISATVSVYEGSAVSALTEVPGSGSGSAHIRFATSPGVTYRIRVAESGLDPAPGVIHLALRRGTPPPNDDFPGKAVAALPFTDSVDTTFATIEGGEASVSGATAWYTFTATRATDLLSDVRASSFEARVSVYTDETLDIPGGVASSAVCALGNVRLDHVAAGQTVYIQVGSAAFPGDGGIARLSLREGTAADVAAACPAPTPPPPGGSPAIPSPPHTGTGAAGESSGRLLFGAAACGILSLVAVHVLVLMRRRQRR